MVSSINSLFISACRSIPPIYLPLAVVLREACVARNGAAVDDQIDVDAAVAAVPRQLAQLEGFELSVFGQMLYDILATILVARAAYRHIRVVVAASADASKNAVSTPSGVVG